VRVVWGDVPVEDPGTGRALPAGDRHEVLERDWNAEQRPQPIQGRHATRPRRRESRIGGICLGKCSVAIDRQPGIQRPVVPLSRGKVRLGQVPG
jgi:hypothetical protein